MNILPVTPASAVASAVTCPSFSLDPSVVVLALFLPFVLVGAYYLFRLAKADLRGL